MKKSKKDLIETEDSVAEETIENQKKEKAEKEQEKLDRQMDIFFKQKEINYPGNATNIPEEEKEESEEVLVSINQDGSLIIKQEKEEVEEKETKQKMSIVDKMILEQVIMKRKNEILENKTKITKHYQSFVKITGGIKIYEDLEEAARKEINELNSVIISDEYDLSKIKNEEISKRVKDHLSDFVHNLFKIEEELK